MSKELWLALGGAVVLSPAAVDAAEEALSIFAKSGYAMPTGKVSEAYGPAPTYEFGIGYEFGDGRGAIEGSISTMASQGDLLSETESGLWESRSLSSNTNANTLGFNINIKGRKEPSPKGLSLHGIVGGSFNTFSEDFDLTESERDWFSRSGRTEQSSINRDGWGINVGGGFEQKLSENIYLTGELVYRYIQIANRFSDGTLNASQVVAQLGFIWKSD
jgi:hypothetical protein